MTTPSNVNLLGSTYFKDLRDPRPAPDPSLRRTIPSFTVVFSRNGLDTEERLQFYLRLGEKWTTSGRTPPPLPFFITTLQPPPPPLPQLLSINSRFRKRLHDVWELLGRIFPNQGCCMFGLRIERYSPHFELNLRFCFLLDALLKKQRAIWSSSEKNSRNIRPLYFRSWC